MLALEWSVVTLVHRHAAPDSSRVRRVRLYLRQNMTTSITLLNWEITYSTGKEFGLTLSFKAFSLFYDYLHFIFSLKTSKLWMNTRMCELIKQGHKKKAKIFISCFISFIQIQKIWNNTFSNRVITKQGLKARNRHLNLD